MDPMASPTLSTQAVDLLQANHVVLVQVAHRHQAMGKMYQLDICGSHDGIKQKIPEKNMCLEVAPKIS